ncbi:MULTISPECIES: hypothetical protein [Petrotoga]|uniref:hypothetical protein n=1 Tax=Petrotoga TaxID=28236 RepID=UPI0011AFD1C1|nr:MULTISPECIES: hypothetical protein [Petrotoga]
MNLSIAFKKEFAPSYLDKVIVFTVFKGIKEGIFDTSYLVVDSYPIIFNSFFNNKKSHGKFEETGFRLLRITKSTIFLL